MRRCSKYNYNQEPVPGVRGQALDIDGLRVTKDEIFGIDGLRGNRRNLCHVILNDLSIILLAIK